jgi:putative salt-induced outer membrane protein
MRTLALLSAAVVALASPVAAQQLTLDLGFVNASGNSDVTSFNLGDKLSWTLSPKVVFTQNGKVLYGKTDGSTTSESYDAGSRLQYTLSSRVGIYGLLTFQRDPFAGLAERWSGGPGVAFGVVRSPRDTLSLETGITEQRERNTAGVHASFAAARSAAAFKHLFGKTSFLTETLEWVANLETSDDQRVNSETALTAPISRQIALKVAYLIRFDNLPDPGFKKTDRILTTGIQVAF